MLLNEGHTPLLEKPGKYSLLNSVKSLSKNPKEFWLLYLVEILTICPFSISVISTTLYTTRILFFTDIQSGLIMGSFGLVIGVMTIILSSLPARFGLRLSLLLSCSMGIVFNILMTLSFHRYIQLALMATIFLPSTAISIITLKLSVKLYTYQDNRSVGYSLFYMVFFTAGGLAGGVVDLVLHERSTLLEPYQQLMITNVCLYSIGLVVSLFMRNLDIGESGEKVLEFKRNESNWQYLKEVFVTARFWRFFLLISLLTVIKSMYFHLTATLPLYVKRDYGEEKHFGILMGAHQAVLLLFIPILTGLIRYFDFYNLVILGSLSTALSPFVLFFEDSFFMLGVFVVVLSIGEAIYAPRLVDFTLEAAPKGKEAIYLGLANMPNSIGLLVTGISSGLLMNEYCPATGERDCYLVWIFIGLYCLVVCFFVIVFKKYFNQKNEDDVSAEMKDTSNQLL